MTVSMSTTWRLRAAGRTFLALAASLLAVALPTAANAAGSAGSRTIITVSASPAGPLVENFNPFSDSNPMNLIGGADLINEPLFITNPLDPSKVTPWLATSWSFNGGDTVLTVDLHSKVRWSDGRPFSASDVAFTFDLLAKNPALDLEGLPVTSATAVTPDQAKIVFSADASTYLPLIGETPIVPEHIWEGVTDPSTYTNPDPIGTGPYVLQQGSFSSQGFLLVKNPDYWQKDLEPKIYGFRFLTYDSNTSANLALESGQLEWAGNFVPEITTAYLGRSPDYHYWFPPTGTAFLCPNDSLPKYQNVDVRKAISLAINRRVVSAAGEQHEEPPATSATGLTLPLLKSSLEPRYANDLRYDPAEAIKLLEAAGYHRGPGGVMTSRDGTQLSVTLNVPSSFTDTLADDQIVAEELRAVGIKASVDATSEDQWVADLVLGDSDMTLCESSLLDVVDTPYENMQVINGNLTKPVGQLTLTDTERYNNPTADRLIHQYASTTDPATQKQALDALQTIMVDDVPVIPLVYGVAWGEYTTAVATGWPSASNPYATDSPSGPNLLMVALHLEPVR